MLVCRRGMVSPILVSQNHLPQMQPGSKPWASCWRGLSRVWQQNCPKDLPLPEDAVAEGGLANQHVLIGGASCGFRIEIKTFSYYPLFLNFPSRESGGGRGIEIPRGRRVEGRCVGLGEGELDRQGSWQGSGVVGPEEDRRHLCCRAGVAWQGRAGASVAPEAGSRRGWKPLCFQVSH